MNSLRPWQAIGIAALAAVPLAASAQPVHFAQVDISNETTTVVLARALRGDSPGAADPLITASYVRWDTGSIASAGYLHRWALAQGAHTWLAGAGVNVAAFRSRTQNDEDEDALSLRLATEVSGPLAGGRYFALLQYSTFRSQTFAMAQYDFANSPFGLELSVLDESEHHQTGFAVRYALDSKRRWQARTGLVHTSADTQLFVGLAFNGF